MTERRQYGPEEYITQEWLLNRGYVPCWHTMLDGKTVFLFQKDKNRLVFAGVTSSYSDLFYDYDRYYAKGDNAIALKEHLLELEKRNWYASTWQSCMQLLTTRNYSL